MKVLVVCSSNISKKDFDLRRDRPFIYEQVEELRRFPNVGVEYFFVDKKGIRGYLSKVLPLRKTVILKSFDIVHCHGGLTGIVGALAFVAPPIVVTLHGSDVNQLFSRILVQFFYPLFSRAIFVSNKLMQRIVFRWKSKILPCGVDLSLFKPVPRKDALKSLSLDEDKCYILFASSFSNRIKNPELAKSAVLGLNNIFLVELEGKTREEVNLLLNASHLLLMTSHSEGSPQIIKEAMAVNCPIISTDVGDVSEVLGNAKYCYIVDHDIQAVQEKVFTLTKEFFRSNGRELIQNYRNEEIAEQLLQIYNGCLKH